MYRVALVVLASFAACRGSRFEAPLHPHPAQPAPQDSIAAKTKGMQRSDGFFPFYFDAKKGAIWLEIPRLGEEFLYVPWLATGLGSNPVGLDRGQLGQEKLVRFERVGPKVLLVQRNLRYRARTDNADEQRAVAESFAQSVIWGGEVAAETDGRVLVDFTGFVLRDARGVARTLSRSGEGSFRLDKKRSALYLPRTKAFPDNTEFEVTLTFESSSPGRRVRETTPTPSAVTLRQRHSLVKLPRPGYSPRRFDPRCGSISVAFADYATPLDQPLEKRWIIRHRLSKDRPIVYYLDRGAPEPVRKALLEGARWWSEAFAAAGFENGFRVELLPEGADPLDVRYNVIQWVHRSTRGWSYGRSVVDPRTGEILKGHVSLGSLRVRQDRLIFEGIARPAGACCAGGGPDVACFVPFDPNADSIEVSLARIRQLSAHEIGHTLGFAHNFAASTFGRASVMDYPAPLVRLTEAGGVDLSKAYDSGIGEWDKITVRYAYTEFATPQDEAAGLEAILQEARREGMVFVTDQDARSLGSAHARASLWDNGADPVRELERVMAVRRATLARFGAGNLARGRPLCELEELLVPLYLQHRYQVAAAAKVLGGSLFEYSVKGDGSKGPRPVSPAEQRRALEALLKTLDPAELVLPERVLELLAPPAYGRNSKAETFAGRTGAVFDPVAAATVAIDMTIDALLEPTRAARLVQMHARDSKYPGFGEVLEGLIAAVWTRDRAKAGGGPGIAILRACQRALADKLIALASRANVDSDVRDMAAAFVVTLPAHERVKASVDIAFEAELRRKIKRFANRARPPVTRQARPEAPPGSPIGK